MNSLEQETRQKSSFAKMLAGFDALAPREQKLLFWGIPLTIMVVAFLLILEPMMIQIAALEKNQKSLDNQQRLVQQSINELMEQAKVDPNKDIKLQIESLIKRLEAINSDFDSELSQLIAPETMPLVLEQLFSQAKDLTLDSMQSKAPEIIFSQGNGNTPIYKHGIEISFSGNFFASQDFLLSAEQLGWKLYWQDISYEVGEYPNAKTQLSIFTLSTSEAFISVQ